MKQSIFTIILSIFLLQSGSSYSQRNDRVRFGVCSDVHLNIMHDGVERLTAFVNAMNKEQPGSEIIRMGWTTSWESGYSERFRNYMKPEITSRKLR